MYQVSNIYSHLVIEPIEQNVQSTDHKGMYELTLIEQFTRSLSRFRMEAKKYNSITSNKSPDAIEKLFWKSL
jgi:hypothetical protein